jgi:hypothetical protein
MARHSVERLPSFLDYATSEEDDAVFELNESLKITLTKTCRTREALDCYKSVATVVFSVVNASITWRDFTLAATSCDVLYMSSDSLITECTLLRYAPNGGFRLSDVHRTTVDTIAMSYKRALTHHALFELLRADEKLLNVLITVTYLNRMSRDLNKQLGESSIIVGPRSIDVSVGHSDVVIQNASSILREERSYECFCSEIVKNWRPL